MRHVAMYASPRMRAPVPYIPPPAMARMMAGDACRIITTPLAIQWSGEGPGFLFGVTGRMAIGALVVITRGQPLQVFSGGVGRGAGDRGERQQSEDQAGPFHRANLR